MAEKANDSTRFSLRRWSQRKREAARASGATGDVDAARIAALAQPRDADGSTSRARQSGASPEARPPAAASASIPAEASAGAASLPRLPSLESLTIDSDYTAFMRPGVDDSLKCGAMKKLFSDPRFNVMDGLDVYIADYSIPDPIDPAIVRTLNQARYIFNPPATRVNEQGYAEDVPESELQPAIGDASRPPADPPRAVDAPASAEALEAPCAPAVAQTDAQPLAQVAAGEAGAIDGVPAPESR